MEWNIGETPGIVLVLQGPLVSAASVLWLGRIPEYCGASGRPKVREVIVGICILEPSPSTSLNSMLFYAAVSSTPIVLRHGNDVFQEFHVLMDV